MTKTQRFIASTLEALLIAAVATFLGSVLILLVNDGPHLLTWVLVGTGTGSGLLVATLFVLQLRGWDW